MKVVNFAWIFILAAANFSTAGVIYDARTGGLESGDPLPDIVGAVITWVCDDYGGMYISEVPSGEHRGLRVFPDQDMSQYSPGQVITLTGATYGSFWYSASGGNIVVTGTAEVPWINLTYAEFVLGPWTPYWACPLHFTEGFTVTQGGNNFWQASSILGDVPDLGNSILCGEAGEISIGDCYQGIRGIWDYEDAYLMVLPDGVNIIDCSVSDQAVSLGGVKALFR